MAPKVQGKPQQNIVQKWRKVVPMDREPEAQELIAGREQVERIRKYVRELERDGWPENQLGCECGECCNQGIFAYQEFGEVGHYTKFPRPISHTIIMCEECVIKHLDLQAIHDDEFSYLVLLAKQEAVL